MAKERKPGVLVDLDLDEVSLVDIPANQHAKVVLIKRHEDHGTLDAAEDEAEKALRRSQSLTKETEALEKALRTQFGSKSIYVSVMDLFKKNVVYRLYNIDSVDMDEPELFRVEYSKSDDGSYQFGTPIPVEVVYGDIKKRDAESEEEIKLVKLERRLASVQDGASELANHPLFVWEGEK